MNRDLIFKSSNQICKFRGGGRENGGYLLQKHTYEMYGCVLSVLAFEQN